MSSSGNAGFECDPTRRSQLETGRRTLRSRALDFLVLSTWIGQLKLAHIKAGDRSTSIEISAFDAKNTLGRLLHPVERGEEIIITRHGQPVARLVPNAGRIDPNQTRESFQRIRDRVYRLRLGELHWPSLKKLRDAEAGPESKRMRLSS